MERFHTAFASWLRTGVTVLLWLGTYGWAVSADSTIPKRPAAGDFFHDLADIVDDKSEQELRALQADTFRQQGIPIVVVTVRRISDYTPSVPTIGSFARLWFDTWGIGTQAKNDGILVIVSSQDRKARIELGAAWGGRFDGFCQRLMDQKMVPQFKDGNYGAGLVAAVGSLAEIAKAGPQAGPPSPGLGERVLEHPVMVFNRQHNPIANKFGPTAPIVMIVAGLGCLIAAWFLPEHRKPLVIVGFLLIGIALLFWILIFVFALLGGSRRRSGGGGFGGGSSSGGGGFGGGFSGGGGASGSW